jgi:MYXO-CTERM domain-containing protein
MWMSVVAVALAAPVREGALPAPSASSAHARHAATFGADAPAPALPPSGTRLPLPTAGPDLRVYGYLAYWSADLATVPWDELTDLAIFNAEAASNGDLTQTSRWDITDEAVAMAAPYGVRVHLCVTNFDPASLDALLSSASARNHLIDQLVQWEGDTGAHGVNIDFEGLPLSVKPEMVQFVEDLDAAVGDVVLATPAVDWAGSWDYDQLTRHADLFIMGYGYHWTGSTYAGPTDPLEAGGGTVWDGVNSYSLTWTVDDYLTWGAVPGRVILGLPLYGTQWPTNDNDVPTRTTGSGTSVVFSEAWSIAASSGRGWEPDARSPYTRSGGEQLWYGDEESVQDRIEYVRDETDLAGIGFWALHYDGDDPSFWDMVHTEARSGADPGPTDTSTEPTDTGTEPGPGPGPGGSPDFTAEAGRPFLAYVGDTVRLSAEGSEGPADPLEYRWTQVEGPPVALDASDVELPTFAVTEPGTLVFELVVGDGTEWSAPAKSWVVVVDPDLARRHDAGCGCAAGGAPSGAGHVAALTLLLAGYRRRSRSGPRQVASTYLRE